jgi:hypothetical protein
MRERKRGLGTSADGVGTAFAGRQGRLTRTSVWSVDADACRDVGVAEAVCDGSGVEDTQAFVDRWVGGAITRLPR